MPLPDAALSRLAIDGGRPVRSAPMPDWTAATGRRFGAEEKRALARVIDSGRLWRVGGTEVSALEEEFAHLIGSRFAVASTSGTSALHLATAAVDPDPGDEMVLPAITDWGTAAAIVATNAVPVFADVDPLTACMTLESVVRVITPRTRAVIVVHMFGGAADVDAIVAYCRPRGITVIEDCAQAYLTVPPGGEGLAGTRGDIGCFSLQQAKHISAGDGGLTVTDDPAIAERMRLFADKGWPRETGVRSSALFGMNYRMNELTGAVARCQLQKLPQVIEDRRSIGRRLLAGLDDLEGLRLASNATPGSHTFWFFPLFLDTQRLGIDYRTFTDAMTAEGVPAGGYLGVPLYAMPPLMEERVYGSTGFPLRRPDGSARYHWGDCPVAERLVGSDLVVVPANENLTEQDVDDTIAAVRKVHDAYA
ncbi:DegT/DnrJ/EryC1/StrS family aminotransferase [Microbacterium sp. 179-I 3D3 NHS]|uniref:DegT/DnrJ/EryC1/StrS family aminotransferase n=1 Tax=Microbacterium sp. 179-I 3D3 NHS TaxID=3142382 RepID=UPI00399F51AD